MKAVFIEQYSEIALLDMDTISPVEIIALLDQNGCYNYTILKSEFLQKLYNDSKDKTIPTGGDKNISICILVDEDNKFNCDKENLLISTIYNTGKRRDTVHGNALIVGERKSKSGESEFCGLEECLNSSELNKFVSSLDALNELVEEANSKGCRDVVLEVKL